MKTYHLDYQEKGLLISNENKSEIAIVKYPKLKDEIALPVQYTVIASDGKLIGAVNSYLPDKNRIELRNGDNYSNLIIGGNDELLLKIKDKKFDIGKTDLEDLAESEIEKLRDLNFSKGYRLRSSSENPGKLDIFEKDGKVRGVLMTQESDYLVFLPIILYEKIRNDLVGKTIKRLVPDKQALQTVRKEGDGPFVKWVKENFKPRLLDNAFAYQDQEGEKDIFFEILDHGNDPIILNGPTGNGKSVLTLDYAFSRQLPYYSDTGGISFKLTTPIGKFVPSPGNPTFAPGEMTLAAIFGGVYVIEEMAPIPQEELIGFNRFLETMEIPITTHFGHELLTAHPNLRIIAAGNFNSNYTTNELNDAFLQRFAQLKIGYPSRDNTVDIIQARAPGLDYSTAESITETLFLMRDAAAKYSRDLGLRGAVEVAQRLMMGTNISMEKLFETYIINPLTTYESSVKKSEGTLYSDLIKIIENRF